MLCVSPSDEGMVSKNRFVSEKKERQKNGKELEKKLIVPAVQEVI